MVANEENNRGWEHGVACGGRLGRAGHGRGALRRRAGTDLQRMGGAIDFRHASCVGTDLAVQATKAHNTRVRAGPAVHRPSVSGLLEPAR